VAGFEEEFHAEGVLVEVFGAGKVVDGDGDLAELFEIHDGGCDLGMAHGIASGFSVVSSANDISRCHGVE